MEKPSTSSKWLCAADSSAIDFAFRYNAETDSIECDHADVGNGCRWSGPCRASALNAGTIKLNPDWVTKWSIRWDEAIINPPWSKEAAGLVLDSMETRVDCQVSEWSDWGSCDSTGQQTRDRQILAKPSRLGRKCPTNLTETRSCPVDCKVSDWSEWTSWDSSGKATRSRSVIQAQSKGGNKCPPLIETKLRPVDCEVGEYGDWSECDPATSEQTRSRSITTAQVGDGAACPLLIERRPCVVKAESSIQDELSVQDDSSSFSIPTIGIISLLVVAVVGFILITRRR